MGSGIRNGILVALGIALAAYGANYAWLHRSQPAGKTDEAGGGSSIMKSAPGESNALLAHQGQRFVLEVRGLGTAVGKVTNDEIWKAVEGKASNYESYRSQNPKDYADGSNQRLTDLGAAETVAFEVAVAHAVQRWPIPVFVWGPPKDRSNSARPAVDIADARQKAGLGATLFLWQEDANTSDPAIMVERLFEFFDTHPDVPQAILFSEDSSTLRNLLGTPGEKPLPQWEYVPAIPDSFVAMVVSRSDRVDRQIRSFAVSDTTGENSDDAKLWHFYWQKTDGQGPDGFEAAYIEHIKNEGFDHPLVPGTMQAAWWQQQLPAFWREISNVGPGQFKPTPYLPIRWTESQVKQFDNAPLIGYLHRPVDVKLTSDQGQLLKTADQAEALKAGWLQALATLPDGVTPKRVFYDTSGDREWAIPLTQAFAAIGKTAPDLGDVREGYDIGRRIANTGASSTMVQMGLGLIAGYADGETSGTVTRRPDGRATIIMVSPPDSAHKAEWEMSHKNVNPFD